VDNMFGEKLKLLKLLLPSLCNTDILFIILLVSGVLYWHCVSVLT